MDTQLEQFICQWWEIAKQNSDKSTWQFVKGFCHGASMALNYDSSLSVLVDIASQYRDECRE